MNPVLRLMDLYLDYHSPARPHARVLRQLNLEIASGEAVGLLGPSGSGKTSLLRFILGLPMPSATTQCSLMEFKGEDMLAMSNSQRHILRRKSMGIIFQDPASRLSPFRAIRRQIADAGGPGTVAPHLGFRSTDRKPDHPGLLDYGFRGLPRVLNSYPHQLSGGECQRIAISQALAPCPSLLLADEPTASLDTVTQKRILDLLLQLRERRQTAMLVVSHDPLFLSALTDRILILKGGALQPYVALTCPPAPSPRVESTFHDSSRPLLEVRELSLDHRPPSAPALARLLHSRSTPAAARFGLHALNLSIEQGKCLAIIGESGSGKSTLARCIAGVDIPGSGQILFDQCPLPTPRTLTHSAQIQLILQDSTSSLNPRLTVFELLSEPLQIHRPHATRAANLADIQQTLQDVSLSSEFLGRRPDQLSGGERQRVAIARAIILKPKLLLLDEAMSGLDSDLQNAILDTVEKIRLKTNFTTIHFTHHLGLMLRVADQIAVMDQGAIVESHPAAYFKARASHPASLRLLDAMLDAKSDSPLDAKLDPSPGSDILPAGPDSLSAQLFNHPGNRRDIQVRDV